MRARQLLLSLLLPLSLLLGLGAAGAGRRMRTTGIWTCRAPAPLLAVEADALVRSGLVARRQGAGRRRRGDDRARQEHPPRCRSPALRSLTVDGKLSFSDKLDIDLKSEWIYLQGGELEIGSEAKPYTRNATITLTDNVPNEDINTMGDRGIVMLGGTLSLHGDRTNAWTKLAKTAKAGSSQIEVLDASGWRKGDQIVLASTDFDPRQAEERTVTAISGNTLTLDQAARIHALRRGHLRGRRARRGRAADPQHQDPGVGRCGEVLLRRAHHGDGRLEDVHLGRRAHAHGPEHAPRPATRSTGTSSARGRVNMSRTPRSTTPTAAA